MEIRVHDIVLCKFYFSDLKQYKNRPVLVFKDNLPYDDFIAIPISSQIRNIHKDEFLINEDNLKTGKLPKSSKLMIRKTFVVSKNSVVKKYAAITLESYKFYHEKFCQYFGCNK